MKKRLLLLIAPIIAIILESLPNGVILKFADPEFSFIETFSYFSLFPFGLAHFGPLPAALLTCVLLLLTFVYVFVPKRSLLTAAAAISIISGLLSVLSVIMFGLEYLNVINAAVTLLLFAEAVMLIVKRKKESQ